MELGDHRRELPFIPDDRGGKLVGTFWGDAKSLEYIHENDHGMFVIDLLNPVDEFVGILDLLGVFVDLLEEVGGVIKVWIAVRGRSGSERCRR